MSGASKTAATVAMWIAVAVTEFGISIYGAESGADIGTLLMVPFLMAVLLTFVLWVVPEIRGRRYRDAADDWTLEKAKRQPVDKMTLLLDLMDDDEREAFKETLKRRVLAELDDSELPEDAATLESLLYDDRPQQHL
jgi:hypothetical protein